VGGPEGDNGLSGKKLVVDHYGPGVPIGGGALCGKDPHKVDRAGALAARQLANKQVEKTEAVLASTLRATMSEDEAERLEARHAVPGLRAALEKHQVEASRATKQHTEALREWHVEREQHYGPLIKAEVKKFDKALDVVRGVHDELLAAMARARADGAGGAAWSEVIWPELTASTRNRSSRIDAWRDCLQRNGWL